MVGERKADPLPAVGRKTDDQAIARGGCKVGVPEGCAALQIGGFRGGAGEGERSVVFCECIGVLFDQNASRGLVHLNVEARNVALDELLRLGQFTGKRKLARFAEGRNRAAAVVVARVARPEFVVVQADAVGSNAAVDHCAELARAERQGFLKCSRGAVETE